VFLTSDPELDPDQKVKFRIMNPAVSPAENSGSLQIRRGNTG
jgi:hypothetical protein